MKMSEPVLKSQFYYLTIKGWLKSLPRSFFQDHDPDCHQ